MRILSLSLSPGAALLPGACAPTPTLEPEASAELAGLNRVSGSGFDEAWANRLVGKIGENCSASFSTGDDVWLRGAHAANMCGVYSRRSREALHAQYPATGNPVAVTFHGRMQHHRDAY